MSDQQVTVRKRGAKLRLYGRRFARNRPALVGALIFVLLVVFALVGGFFTSYDYLSTDFRALSDGPNGEHWFGTNDVGNDNYAQVVHGLQRSLLIAVLVSLGSTVLAALAGASAAFFGGWYGKGVLLLIHFLMVIPAFLVLALFSNDSGGDWRIITIILIGIQWFFPARVIWSMSLSVNEREYIQAARFTGISGWAIVLRHIVPNIGSLLVIQFTLGVVQAVMIETGLSFIGFGVKTPDVSLGSLIGVGANLTTTQPWLFYFPAAALTLLTVSMALVADGLRDALDPTSTAGGRA